MEVDEDAFETLLEDRDKLLEALVDRHGTGRVIFRNTRKALKGFPKRKVVSHKLEASERLSKEEQDSRLCEEFKKENDVRTEGAAGAGNYKYSFKQDSRIQWLAEFLKKAKGRESSFDLSFKRKSGGFAVCAFRRFKSGFSFIP